MKFSEFIVKGGLAHQAAQDYDEQQAGRTHLQRVREHGIKVMESDERRRAAADKLIDKDTALKQLRADIEQNELAFQQGMQPAEQGVRRSFIEHRARMQPGEQRLEGIQQDVGIGQAEAQRRLLPGQAALAGETQNMQLQTLREQQAGNLWAMLSVGDKKGTLELLNSSQLLHPGRKFSDIQRGASPVRGQDGQPLMQGGKPVNEDLVRLVAADGGPDVFVPVKQLQANAAKHGTRYEKVGNNLVRITREGAVSGVYEPDQFGVNPEMGEPYSKRTGMPPAAAGINPGGAPPAAPGAPGARPPAAAGINPLGGAAGATGASRPSRKQEKHLDDRVNDAITKVIFPRYNGTMDPFGQISLPAENKDVAMRVIELTNQFVRQDGMDGVAAARKAVAQAEVEQQRAKMLRSGKPGGRGYTGPTPWR